MSRGGLCIHCSLLQLPLRSYLAHTCAHTQHVWVCVRVCIISKYKHIWMHTYKLRDPMCVYLLSDTFAHMKIRKCTHNCPIGPCIMQQRLCVYTCHSSNQYIYETLPPGQLTHIHTQILSQCINHMGWTSSASIEYLLYLYRRLISSMTVRWGHGVCVQPIPQQTRPRAHAQTTTTHKPTSDLGVIRPSERSGNGP